jgi:hypothetical protein
MPIVAAYCRAALQMSAHLAHFSAQALQHAALSEAHCLEQARHIFSHSLHASSANSDLSSNRLAQTRHMRSQVVQILAHCGRSSLQQSAQVLHSLAQSLHAATHFADFDWSSALAVPAKPENSSTALNNAMKAFMDFDLPGKWKPDEL